MELLQNLWNGILDLTKLLVIPDWSALIALLPVFMGALVVLFVIGLVLRYRKLGPRRRRPGRLKPVAPAGIHMPGPSLAPFYAAGASTLLFLGLVFPGPLLVIGLVGLVLSLLYWGREGMVEYDHLAEAAPELPAVVETGPPPGVHVPGPSFRPLLASLGATILFAGLVWPGPILAVGLLFLIVALLGWLNDARKEYRHVVVADTTGHLENEPAPAWPKTVLSVFAFLVVVAVALNAGLLPPRSASGGVAAGGSAPPSGGPGGSAGPGGPGPGGIELVAAQVKFDKTAITAPADTGFKITLDNKDAGTNHDVDIVDASGAKVYDMKDFAGPKVETHDVPALKAGAYTFECSIHPALMNGTLTVGG